MHKLTLLALLLCGCTSAISQPPFAIEPPLPLLAKPAFSGVTHDGKRVSTDDYRGKVILVDFWATWCGPCREKLPELEAIHREFHGQGLQVVGVAQDTQESLAAFVGVFPLP